MEVQLKCQTLIELFNQSLGRVELAEKPYLEIVRTEREEKLTFGQLWRKGREFAVHLIQSRDIRAGDKIAILGKNRADWDVALWGIILAGAVPVLIDPERRVEGVKKHLLHTDAKLLVMADDYQDGSCREKLKEFLMPPHHSFGLTVGKLLPLWVGATNLYTNRYRQISHFIRDKRITIFVGIPALFTVFARKIEQRIAEQKEKKRLVRLTDRYLSKLVGKRIVKKLGWGSLRFFVSGAAPVPKWVLEIFWRRGLELWEGYGTTENSPIYGFNANRKKLGSVGKPISTLSVKIVNEQDQKLGPGEAGEIVLGGPCVMKGYYKNPKATQAVIKTDKDGVRWLHTGDLGYMDEDGYLFVTGRKKNLIVLPCGKNVSPELVELALSKAQYVEELVVVPSYQEGPASVEQEAVKAIVRPAWEQIEAETKLCRRDLVEQPGVLKNLVWQSINKCQQENQELAGFEKIPSRNLVEIEINEFQKTSMGKIKRSNYIEAGRVRR